MKYRERNLGPSVAFLLPSLKLKEPSVNGRSIENILHSYLMEHFAGYTAQAGNIFGYWREVDRDTYGEHREFSIAAAEPAQIPALKEFLAGLASELKEECIFFRAGGTTSLIYPDQETAPGAKHD
jgi:hypothetical protein